VKRKIIMGEFLDSLRKIFQNAVLLRIRTPAVRIPGEEIGNPKHIS